MTRAGLGLGWLEWKKIGGCTPALSVITVFRRDFEGLRATVESLAPLLALGSDVELIVIEGDDRHWPESNQVRASLSSLAVILKWCRMPDLGIYDAMNRGILAAQGEWIWFVNAGDVLTASLEPQLFLEQLRSVPESCFWAIGDVRIVSEHGDLAGTSKYHSLEGVRTGRFPICHQGVLVRSRAVALIVHFDVRMRISADYRMFLKLCALGEPHRLGVALIDFLTGGASALHVRRREIENLVAREQVLRRAFSQRALDYLRCCWRQVLFVKV